MKVNKNFIVIIGSILIGIVTIRLLIPYHSGAKKDFDVRLSFAVERGIPAIAT